MVKSRYEKKTSPIRLKKSVMVILPRVDINEFLRERRRRSLSLQPNTSPSSANCSSQTSVVSQIASATSTGRVNRRRFRVKREPPCVFHSQVDINDDSIEEIPGVLGEPINPSLCLHEITRSMCYMCSPHPAEDKTQVWNEISTRSTPASGSGYRGWHVPTPFVSNSNVGAPPTPANIEPQPTPNVEAPIVSLSAVEFSDIPVHNNSIAVRSCESIGVGTENDFDRDEISKETRDGSSQTVRYFPCKHCPALFTDVMHVIHHKTVHQKMFECPFCTANFAAKNDLKSHVKMHLPPHYYDCVYCNQSFRKKHDIRDHLALHAEEKQFQCQLCPARFKQKINLRNHEQSHKVSKFIHVFKKVDDDNTGPATTPTKAARRSGSIPKKVAGNSTPRPTSYLELSSIEDSRGANTSSGTTASTMPQRITPSSVSASSTKNAVLSETVPDKNFYKCQFCPLSFKQYNTLKHHNLCHIRKTGKFICPACGGRFMKKIGLILHQKHSHTRA